MMTIIKHRLSNSTTQTGKMTEKILLILWFTTLTVLAREQAHLDPRSEVAEPAVEHLIQNKDFDSLVEVAEQSPHMRLKFRAIASLSGQDIKYSIRLLKFLERENTPVLIGGLDEISAKLELKVAIIKVLAANLQLEEPQDLTTKILDKNFPTKDPEKETILSINIFIEHAKAKTEITTPPTTTRPDKRPANEQQGSSPNLSNKESSSNLNATSISPKVPSNLTWVWGTIALILASLFWMLFKKSKSA